MSTYDIAIHYISSSSLDSEVETIPNIPQQLLDLSPLRGSLRKNIKVANLLSPNTLSRYSLGVYRESFLLNVYYILSVTIIKHLIMLRNSGKFSESNEEVL